ncbi:MAG: hypothetical protein ACU0AT_09970 [Tranquillimonas sp.]
MSESLPQVAKIKLKVGTMELEYEGDPEFLTGGIEALLETMGGLASKVPAEAPLPAPSTVTSPATANGSVTTATAQGAGFTFSTNTIAAHLSSNSGSDLVICAIAQLEFVQGKTSSTRSEVLAEMKTATTYYKNTYSNNLSKSFETLLKSKRINQIAKDTYALSAYERKQLEAKIADIG